MKFKGKIDAWFWIVMLLGEALILAALFTPEDGRIIGILVLVFYNIIFLPFVFRNYVEVTEEKVSIAFGFSKESIAISEIQEVYETNNPISSSAASLDRIVIKGRQKTMMCAVREKERFFTYLKEKNPDIVFGNRGKGTDVITKFSLIFCVIIFVAVGILLLTGDIQMEYREDSFTIKASYWYDEEIEYAEIESIQYVDEKVSGSRTGGFASFRLLLGNFENDEYGNYTRYTYANCEAGVVLFVDDREVVISGKDKESTKEIYEELVKRCGM